MKLNTGAKEIQQINPYKPNALFVGHKRRVQTQPDQTLQNVCPWHPASAYFDPYKTNHSFWLYFMLLCNVAKSLNPLAVKIIIDYEIYHFWNDFSKKNGSSSISTAAFQKLYR